MSGYNAREQGVQAAGCGLEFFDGNLSVNHLLRLAEKKCSNIVHSSPQIPWELMCDIFNSISQDSPVYIVYIWLHC